MSETVAAIAKKLATLSEDEQFDLLATDGMLIKRPILVTEKSVLLGFKPVEWKNIQLL